MMASSSSFMSRRRVNTGEEEQRSGGKIARGRRRYAARTTPYDLPPYVPTTEENEAAAARARVRASPNWVTGVLFPKIASGAAKLLSSLVADEDDDNTDSSSSSPGSGSADGGDEIVAGLYKKDRITPEFDEFFREGSQLTTRKSKTKHLIEELIMQEIFSREECERLISMINSRVIDGSTTDDGIVARSDIPDLRTEAILETKKWAQETKDVPNSKLLLDRGISALDSVMVLQATKDGFVSPVDVAKSYMRERPPWASPSINSAGEQTPVTIGRELLKDEKLYASSCSTSKRKISSLSSGSWKLQDEIRRVRSKATEDMLNTPPLKKSDFSCPALKHKNVQSSLQNGKSELGQRDKLQNSNFCPLVKSVDASSELMAAGVSTSCCLPASALDTTKDGLATEDSQLQQVTLVQNLIVEDIQIVGKEKSAASGSLSPSIPEPALEHGSRLGDRSCPPTDGDIELTGYNGITFPRPSLSEKDGEDNLQHSDDKNPNIVSSRQDELADSAVREETCELLSETSIDVPGMNEIDDVAFDDSHSNSMKHTEQGPTELRQQKLKQGLKGKATPKVDNQLGKKVSRNNRKVKGKG